MKRRERTLCSPRPFTGEGLGEREWLTLLMLCAVLLLNSCASPPARPKPPPKNLPALLQTCSPSITFNPPTTLRPMTLGAITATVESAGFTCEWEF